MFIQTEATGEPGRLKFLPGREVLSEGALEFWDKAKAAASPLVERLFAIPGVAAVSLGKDSITVVKAAGEWHHLKPLILSAIMEHFLSGAPVLRACATAASALSPTGKAADAIAEVKDALRRVIDPELGYNIVDLGLVYDVVVEEGGIVRITMTTTTPGCPATNYLKRGAGEAASHLPGVTFVDVKLTYEPRWAPEMMSPAAKAYFGIPD